MAAPSPLRQRLLQDIAELQSNPYPNISLHVRDEDITQACLILKVDGYGPMHLTVNFRDNYPLSPPTIQMNSDIHHPNIFGNYICASILNTTEGYTPAYTLKGIAIQLLSFFSSDKIEQSGGGYSHDLDAYRNVSSRIRGNVHICRECQFGVNVPAVNTTPVSLADFITPQTLQALEASDTASQSTSASGSAPSSSGPTILGRNARRRKARGNKETAAAAALLEAQSPKPSGPEPVAKPIITGIQDAKLPDEILLLICEKLDTEDLMAFAGSWSKIGILMTSYDLIRTRELQCFCFKKDYMTTKLGVGVSVEQRGRLGFFESEFDLLSQNGYQNYNIRRSVLGVPFQNWLPLPISYGHWRKVKDDVPTALSLLSTAAHLGNVPSVQVIFHFMNDIVVKLNHVASEVTIRAPYYPYAETAKSSLTHASEKAIESYFHLFHLLLCLATSQPSIVATATHTLRSFMARRTSKSDCPNLGHLLVAALISEVEITEPVMKAIIRETITRNVVWMLDTKGAGMAELSYMEPSPISHYRLKKTFEASKTSYRLLMFLNLFRRTAVGSPRKPLTQLRDEAFARHGAPPRGAAKGLADSIKRIHQVKNFPDFLTAMGLEKPGPTWFTTFLRDCVRDSIKKGYSRMPISQGEALMLRRAKEPEVEVAEGVLESTGKPNMSRRSFFPDSNGGGFRGGRGGGGDRGGRAGRAGRRGGH